VNEAYEHAIIVIVDQLRADYICPELTPNLTRIFKLDSEERPGWDVCYAPTLTETCHATLSTVSTPGEHGVIGDGSFSRDTGRYELYKERFLDRYWNDNNPSLLTTLATRSGLRVVAVAGKDVVVDLLASSDIYLKVKLALLEEGGSYEVNATGVPSGVSTLFLRRIEQAGLTKLSAADARTPILDRHVSSLATTGLNMLRPQERCLLVMGLSALDRVGHKYGPNKDERNVAEAIRIADEEIGRVWRAALTKIHADPSSDADSAPILLVVTGDHGCRLISNAIIPSKLGAGWERLDLWQTQPEGQDSLRTASLAIPSEIRSLVAHAESDGGTIRFWLNDRGSTAALERWVLDARFSNGSFLHNFISEVYGTQGTSEELFQYARHDNLGDLVVVAGEDCAFFKPNWIDDLVREQGKGTIPIGEHGTHFPSDRLVPCLLPHTLQLPDAGHDRLSDQLLRLLGLVT